MTAISTHSPSTNLLHLTPPPTYPPHRPDDDADDPDYHALVSEDDLQDVDLDPSLELRNRPYVEYASSLLHDSLVTSHRSVNLAKITQPRKKAYHPCSKHPHNRRCLHSPHTSSRKPHPNPEDTRQPHQRYSPEAGVQRLAEAFRPRVNKGSVHVDEMNPRYKIEYADVEYLHESANIEDDPLEYRNDLNVPDQRCFAIPGAQ